MKRKPKRPMQRGQVGIDVDVSGVSTGDWRKRIEQSSCSDCEGRPRSRIGSMLRRDERCLVRALKLLVVEREVVQPVIGGRW